MIPHLHSPTSLHLPLLSIAHCRGGEDHLGRGIPREQPRQHSQLRVGEVEDAAGEVEDHQHLRQVPPPRSEHRPRAGDGEEELQRHVSRPAEEDPVEPGGEDGRARAEGQLGGVVGDAGGLNGWR